jgi:hypothetical protein
MIAYAAPVPLAVLRRIRQDQSNLDYDPFGVPGRRWAPQFLTDYLASLGCYHAR